METKSQSLNRIKDKFQALYGKQKLGIICLSVFVFISRKITRTVLRIKLFKKGIVFLLLKTEREALMDILAERYVEYNVYRSNKIKDLVVCSDL